MEKLLIDSFEDQFIIEMTLNFVNKDFPNTQPFFQFIHSVSNGVYEVLRGKFDEWDERLIDFEISHRKVNLAIKTFWKAYFERKGAIGRDYRGNWVMMYNQMFKGPQLTNMQHRACLKFYVLMEYDGYLKINGNPMGRIEIGEYLGYEDTSNESAFRKGILDPILEAKIILSYKIKGMGSKTFYRVNPEFVFKGKKGPDLRFVKLFQKTMRHAVAYIEELEKRNERINKNKKKKRTSAVGTLHACLPFVHKQTFYLAKDPDTNILKKGETIKEAIDREAMKVNRKEHILLKDEGIRKLAVKGDKAGLNKKDFESHIKIITEAGILHMESSGGSQAYRIFPLLAFTHSGDGKDEYTVSVIKDFYRTWGSKRDTIIKKLGLEKIHHHFPELKLIDKE